MQSSLSSRDAAYATGRNSVGMSLSNSLFGELVLTLELVPMVQRKPRDESDMPCTPTSEASKKSIEKAWDRTVDGIDDDA